MIEIRIHGRGGQGAVIASKILAVAMFAEGKHVQAFPKFGVERRGAPVEAFLRLDQEKIYVRSEITRPDHIVVLDATLTEVMDVTTGLKENGWIIINSNKSPSEFSFSKDFQLACVDASRIATDLRLGSKSAPIVNTAICGAFAKCTKLVSLGAVIEAIKEEVPVKADANQQAAEIAFNSIVIVEG